MDKQVAMRISQFLQDCPMTGNDVKDFMICMQALSTIITPPVVPEVMDENEQTP
tara:strand:- start:1584 stop:1745 length:162 start_codon:yes stop_codon:yes gene_type:complete